MAHCRSSRPGPVLSSSGAASGLRAATPCARAEDVHASPPLYAATSTGLGLPAVRARLADLGGRTPGANTRFMVVMQVIVRHQDRCARRLDHRHDAAIRVQRADSISQKWTFCTWRKVRRHGCWDGQSRPI